ncbi:MAG: cytochrome c [Planctomycetaceae bacterium]
MDSRLPKRLLRLSALPILCVLCGCGGGETANTLGDHSAATASTESVSGAAGSGPVDGASLAEVNRGADEVWVDFEGRRHIGKVPYDVFFDHPLAVATDDQIVGRNHKSKPETARDPGALGAVPKADPVAPTPELPSGIGWASLLPAEVLEAEVKFNRNFLNQKLRSVGNYNSSVTMIPVSAAMIAVMAAIAIEHSEEVSWKEDAAYIRDLAASMNADPLQRGLKDQRRLLRLFDNLNDTLNRSRPAGLPKPDPKSSLSDVAEMRLVMMRMRTAEQRLQTEVNESSFESQQGRDLVLHEAALLSGLVKAVTTASYGFADDPDFNEYARDVAEQGQAMRAAVEAGDFNAFELNRSRMTDTCQRCHRDYKSN